MNIIDTHSHLYAEEFKHDRAEVIQRAEKVGLKKILLPNIDRDSWQAMHELCDVRPDLFLPMAGLHPTSVKEDYREQLQKVEQALQKRTYVAIGEIGIDLYWDKSYARQQEEALRFQFDLALEHDLPVVIHMRNSYDSIMPIVDSYRHTTLRGVFHCFTGNEQQARQIIDHHFLLGIGGVLTFKNSKLSQAIENISPQHLVVETDAPYLAPVPYRGKRNESSYIIEVIKKLSLIYDLPEQQIAQITSKNAIQLFNLNL